MFLNPQALYTFHRGQDNGTGPSPRLWSRMLGASKHAADGNMRGYFTGDDFRHFGLSTAVSSNVGRYGSENCQYISYEDTGDAIAQVATDRRGVITFTTAGTDNNESWLQPGGAGSVSALISDTAGDDKMQIFECRAKVGTLAECGVFLGLSEESLAAANTLVDDTGALASKDLIGFHAPLAASTSVLDFVYRKAGQTAQVLIDDVHTLVADTYVKLGFVYDPYAPRAKRIAAFVNGVEQSTYVTGTLIEAATFPDGEELQPLFGLKTGAAAAKTLSLDWWFLYSED